MMHSIQIALVAGLVASLSGQALAETSSSRYQSWRPPAGDSVQSAPRSNNKDAQAMIDELNRLINDADKARAADRRFIEDLRDVINKYDWPWRKTLMDEDFTDGTTKKHPAWEMVKGNFTLRRGPGLQSSITAQAAPQESPTEQSRNDVAAALIDALLDEALKTKKQSTSPSEQASSYASIINKTSITNSFAIKASIDVRSQQGRLEIGVYQSRSTGNGYRLAFLPGPSASIEIQRIGSRGKSIIDVAERINAKGDRVHHLLWTRDANGNMNIKLNEQSILQTSDRSYKDRFDGIVINNMGGEFAIQRITIHGS